MHMPIDSSKELQKTVDQFELHLKQLTATTDTKLTSVQNVGSRLETVKYNASHKQDLNINVKDFLMEQKCCIGREDGYDSNMHIVKCMLSPFYCLIWGFITGI